MSKATKLDFFRTALTVFTVIALALFILLLMFGSQAQASDSKGSSQIITSEAAGIYNGEGAAYGWACHIKPYSTPLLSNGSLVPWNEITIQCINSASHYRGGSITYGPTGIAGYCPTTYNEFLLIGFNGTDVLKLESYSGGYFNATLNGTAVTFRRTNSLSVTPVGCGGTSISKDR